MKQRIFGRLGWQVGEVGFGMWGMGGWTDSDDKDSLEALRGAPELGINFYDTAWEYGEGRSEKLLGELLADNPKERLFVATKIPPKTMVWPSHRGDRLEESFPPDHIREYVEKSLENLAIDKIDLIQFHVWEDDWAHDERWARTLDDLRNEGLVEGVGISINRWEPWNGLETVRTGLIDSVQVIYNIFDQAPEDELFPLCRERDVAVIARVPLDEGSLADILTPDSTWDDDDWRRTYFTPHNLGQTLERVAALREHVPANTTMAQMALQFVLSNPDVAVVIPGMRRIERVGENAAVSALGPLSAELMAELGKHRWDRIGPEWEAESQV